MIQFEDECVGCPQGCISCGRKHVPHFYCDNCGEEIDLDDLYKDDDEMLCRDCILSRFQAKPDYFYD